MNNRSGRVQRFPIGMTYESKRFPKARDLTTYKVVDVLRTFNSVNDCVGIEYVVEHLFAGQPVTERVVDTTIARNLTNEQLSQYLITNKEQ
jgi:hypothetical protein